MIILDELHPSLLLKVLPLFISLLHQAGEVRVRVGSSEEEQKLSWKLPKISQVPRLTWKWVEEPDHPKVNFHTKENTWFLDSGHESFLGCVEEGTGENKFVDRWKDYNPTSNRAQNSGRETGKSIDHHDDLIVIIVMILSSLPVQAREHERPSSQAGESPMSRKCLRLKSYACNGVVVAVVVVVVVVVSLTNNNVIKVTPSRNWSCHPGLSCSPRVQESKGPRSKSPRVQESKGEP